MTCDYRMQSPALVQNIFKICTFLPKLSNNLPFFNISLRFFWKPAPKFLLSRIGPVWFPPCYWKSKLSVMLSILFKLFSNFTEFRSSSFSIKLDHVSWNVKLRVTPYFTKVSESVSSIIRELSKVRNCKRKKIRFSKIINLVQLIQR